MVIKDIEREDIEFVCKTLGCRPIASLDHFVPENLVKAELAEEISEPSGKYVKVNNPTVKTGVSLFNFFFMFILLKVNFDVIISSNLALTTSQLNVFT